MSAIPFPLSTAPGERPQEGSGRLINAYAVPRGSGRTVYHRVPGAVALGVESGLLDWTWWGPGFEWFNVAESAFVPTGSFRGGVVVNEMIYGAFGEKVNTVDSSGSYVELGSLAGTDHAFFARNNNVTPQIVVVVDAGPFQVVGGSVIAYPDGDIGSPNSVTFHEGYFIFTYGSGRLQASGVNVTDINTLDFVNAESNPDGLLRAWSYQGQLYAAGPATIEVYGGVGAAINLTGFPFNRVDYNITPGLISATAVAGFEPEFGNAPIYCASDNTVRQLNGFTADKISPPDLDRLIADVADKTTLEALVYVVDGVPFWQLSSPDWSWVYNLNNEKWHERQSYLLERSRFTSSIFAFDKWLAGDTESGNLLTITGSQLQEAGLPLIFTVESGPVEDFPNRMRVARADFDFTMGVGSVIGVDPIETDPTALIEYSDDGGVFWKSPYERKLGRQQKTLKRIILPPTGMTGAQGRRWRIRIADPVHIGFMGGTMDETPLRK